MYEFFFGCYGKKTATVPILNCRESLRVIAKLVLERYINDFFVMVLPMYAVPVVLIRF